jgi:predicted ester cyclase
MSTEENKAKVRELFDAVNAQDYDAVDALMAPELAHQMKDVIRWAHAVFEGHQATITELVAEGDQVVALLATSGGHSGEFEGIPPTGKHWTNTGFTFCRFANGKITEQTMLFDGLDHVKQLGATISPPRAATVN